MIKIQAPLLPALLLAFCTAAAAQDRKDAPAAAPAEGGYPKWSVQGYVSVDFNVLAGASDARSSMEEEGVVGEFGLGGSLHLARSFRFEVKACSGCHGLEVQNAYLELDLASFVSVRAGRIPVPFGSFSQRSNPSQMESTSKPLPYIMGRMARDDAFNQGILPAPLVDNGAAIFGNTWLGSAVQVGYEIAGLRGYKGDSPDLAFDSSRDYEDNNGEPAAAGRLTLAAGVLTLGVSGLLGHYDEEARLDYRVAGADLTLSGGGWNFRAEGLLRDTEILDAAGSADFSRRLAYALQIDGPLGGDVRFFVLQDGLLVQDVFLSPTAGAFVAPAPGLTDDRNTILRVVAGLVVAARPGLLLKVSAEYWDFSDFDDTWVFHMELVGSY